MKLVQQRKTRLEIEDCERCDTVCGPSCRAEAERERAFLTLIHSGLRIA
ncbi:MAG: hypothetical protein ACXVY8_04870 [Gaiellaceae bacterium]